MTQSPTATCAELATITALLERRSSPVKFPQPHLPGYRGHVPGGECYGQTKAAASKNSTMATKSFYKTGTLNGTHGLLADKRPVGEQDFHAEESQLWSMDFGRRQMDKSGDCRSL